MYLLIAKAGKDFRNHTASHFAHPHGLSLFNMLPLWHQYSPHPPVQMALSDQSLMFDSPARHPE